MYPVFENELSLVQRDIRTVFPDWRLAARLKNDEYWLAVSDSKGQLLVLSSFGDAGVLSYPEDRGRVVCDIAELVQQLAFDSGLTSWPQCKRHGEPLWPQCEPGNDKAFWTCDIDGVSVHAIGSLQTPSM